MKFTFTTSDEMFRKVEEVLRKDQQERLFQRARMAADEANEEADAARRQHRRCPFCFNLDRYCSCRPLVRPGAIETTGRLTDAIEATCR